MSNRKIAMTCMALVGAAALLGAEARAGMKTMAGHEGEQRRGCRDLVTLKHPDAKGAMFKKEWNKCMADPNGYNS